MSVKRLAVIFRDTAVGKRELGFACGFSLQAGIPLTVLLPACADTRQYWSSEEARVIECVRAFGVFPDVKRFDSENFELSSDILLVSNDPPSGEFSVLRPFEEFEFNRQDSVVIVVPFGHGDAGRRAAHFAIEFAQERGAVIIFYHTTWKINSVSTVAEDHMSPEAKCTLDGLVSLAYEANIRFVTIIETAEDVVEGFMLCALRSQAAFIVVAQATSVLQGSYVDQVIEMGGAVPILVVGTEVEA